MSTTSTRSTASAAPAGSTTPTADPVRAPAIPDPVAIDDALERALDGLTGDGTLTASQAQRVREARAAAVTGPGEPPGASGQVVTEPGTAGRTGAPERGHGPLPEILGYVGASLVGSAVLSILMQYWPDWSTATHVALVASATLLSYAAAVVLAGLSPNPRAP